MSDLLQPDTLDSTAHVVQVALTPVFLLSGVATLLNVSGQLAQADAAERVRLGLRLDRLRLRSLALDMAVFLAALSGIATWGAVLTLFVGALRDSTVASLLFGLFGAAILCTLCALVAFGFEMLLASSAVRSRIAERRAGAGVPADP